MSKVTVTHGDNVYTFDSPEEAREFLDGNFPNHYPSNITYSGLDYSFSEDVVMVGSKEWTDKEVDTLPDLPDIEVVLNEVLDGYPLLYYKKD
jgi:hypothetical protein